MDVMVRAPSDRFSQLDVYLLARSRHSSGGAEYIRGLSHRIPTRHDITSPKLPDTL